MEIAIVLDSKYIEFGYLTESCKLFIKYLNDNYKYKQVEIILKAENAIENEAIGKLALRLNKVNRVEEIKVFNHYVV